MTEYFQTLGLYLAVATAWLKFGAKAMTVTGARRASWRPTATGSGTPPGHPALDPTNRLGYIFSF